MPHAPDPVQPPLAATAAARRNRILDAAARMFAEKGFHPTTISDIANEAGIAHGSVYTYFANKTALLLGIFERMKEAIMQEYVPQALDMADPRSFVQMLQIPLMGLKQDNFALFRIVVSEMMVNEELRALYYTQLVEPTLALAEAALREQAQKQGMSPLKMQLTMRAISGMILGLMLEYAMGDPVLTTHWAELPDVLADFIVQRLDSNQ